jgi:hypothetical protein
MMVDTNTKVANTAPGINKMASCIYADRDTTRRSLIDLFSRDQETCLKNLAAPASGHDSYTIGLLRGRLAFVQEALQSLKGNTP